MKWSRARKSFFLGQQMQTLAKQRSRDGPAMTTRRWELTVAPLCACAQIAPLPRLSSPSPSRSRFSRPCARSSSSTRNTSPSWTLVCPLPLSPCLCMCLRWGRLLPTLPTLLGSQRRLFLPPRMGSRCRRWKPVPAPLPCALLDLFSCQRDRTQSCPCPHQRPQASR